VNAVVAPGAYRRVVHPSYTADRMAMSSLFDPETPAGAVSGEDGPRPFLTAPQMLALRFLIAIYGATVLLLFAMNYRPLADAVWRAGNLHLAVRVGLGLAVATTLLAFFLLLGMSLHHFVRGHVGPKPPAIWLWVIVLLNVAGVVVYYLKVIEPEQRTLLRRWSEGGQA